MRTPAGKYQNAEELLLDILQDPQVFLQAREALRNKYLRASNWNFLAEVFKRLADYSKQYGTSEANLHLPGEKVPKRTEE